MKKDKDKGGHVQVNWKDTEKTGLGGHIMDEFVYTYFG